MNLAARLTLALFGLFLILLGGRDAAYRADRTRRERISEFLLSPFTFVGGLCLALTGATIGMG